jgi:DMSO reductase family type II enzyme molybdopterin subunit
MCRDAAAFRASRGLDMNDLRRPAKTPAHRSSSAPEAGRNEDPGPADSGEFQLNRRRFLQLTGAAAAAGLAPLHVEADAAQELTAKPPLVAWDELYAQRWTWDAVFKGTHGWVNCRSACNWDLYVKDGVVVREEQAANYAASEPGVPDFNPRGCQKGACYTEVMYGPTRLTVPLKRAGERGAGQWQRIGWDQALDEIANKLVDISVQYGGETIIHDLGPHFDLGATNASRNRFFGMMGAALPDDWAEIGDLNMGATLTFGMPHIGGSSDEWFLSDYLVVWMMNPSVTQIPDAHFLFEAKYNGTELVVIDPVYSATAIHADLWVPLAPGTDTALGLATARHIWQSGRMDEAYVREQSDFPVLVRLDTGRFLRDADLHEGGVANLVYYWDPRSGAPTPVRGCEGDAVRRLELPEGLVPPIEGTFKVTLHDGTAVDVATVGTLVKEALEPWTFAHAATVTGLDPAMIERFAEGFARAKRPMVLSSWGSNRYFHSDHMNRSKILCLTLKGAIGRRGSGYHSTGWIGIDGFGEVAGDSGQGAWGKFKSMASLFGDGYVFGMIVDRIAGRKSAAQVQHALAKHVTGGPDSCMTNSASQNYFHQGIAGDLARETDHLYPRTMKDYTDESLEKRWMPVRPGPDNRPRAWVTGGSNVLRRSNMPQRMLEHLWPGLELVVDINQKFTFTGLHADYLLPAAGYYEKPGIKYSVAYIPYLHYCDRAVQPVGESKDEWEIFSLLAERVQNIARTRGLGPLPGCGSNSVDLTTIADRFSFDGEYGPADVERVNAFIIERSPAAGGVSVATLKRDGISRYANVGNQGIQENLFNSEWNGTGVLTALTDFTERKWSWPTLTGRQQFYIDHPWFIEAGEALPTHFPSPKAGGDYPFQLISCHARWSIHSVWRDTPMMLRLQRGEPVVYLNPGDLQRIGGADGDWVAMRNDYGAMRMRAKASTMVRPRVAYYFHAWEPHQFPDHKSYKFLIPGLMKPLHFAGGEGQIGWFFGHFEPGTHVQDTRVEIRPFEERETS